MHEYESSPLMQNKQLAFDFLASFQFHRKEIISMGTWEHIKLGELPLHNNTIGFILLLGGDPSKYT
jgi:hypothetical protein